MKTKILLLTVLFVLLAVFAYLALGTLDDAAQLDKIANECSAVEESGWIEEFSECEYAEPNWCHERGGFFSECESACRHHPEAEICTMQCVPVCKFGTVEKTSSIKGYLVYGHEVRSFRECGEGQPEHWIMGDSPALDEIKTTYEDLTSDVEPSAYAPLYITIEGEVVDAPQDGFGADYESAIRIDTLANASRTGNCKNNSIIVESPLPGATITSPLEVSGQARAWFFEGDFPLILTDWDGKIIAEGYAKAEGEWMVDELVDFKGTLEFEAPKSGNGVPDRGTLIFQKDNPSDKRELDNAYEILIYFGE